MSETPRDDCLFRSKSTARSLWQEYRVHADRLELDTHLGTVEVPFDAVESLEVAPSDLSRLVRADLHLKDFRPALKLDWANFTEHVVLDRKEGGLRRLLFTPEEPEAFHRAFESAYARYLDERRQT